MEIKVSERCHGTTLRRNANTRCKHTTNRSTLCHQHLKTDKSLRIKETSVRASKGISGRTKYGLFTTGFIPKHGRICYWTGETLEQNPDSKFALQILKKPPTWVDAFKSNTGEARYARACMNPAKCENNAILKHNKKTNQTYLEASRDIEAGEEILTLPKVKNLNKKIEAPIPQKPRRRVRIIVPDEDEFEDFEPEEDLPQGFDADDEPNSPIARPPTPPRIQPSKKKKKPEDASRQEIRVRRLYEVQSASRRDYIKENLRTDLRYVRENKKREEVYELKILKRLLLIQTLFRDSKSAQKNLTRPKPNYKIVPPSDGDLNKLDKLDKLLTKEEKALLQLYKSGGQNRTMTLGDLRAELDALGKKKRR